MSEEHSTTKLLTVNEVCGVLNCTKYEVYRLIHSGGLRAMRNRPGGARYRVPQSAIDEYLATAYSTPVVADPDKAFRTVADIALQLNCSQETVRRLVAAGELEATRFAGRTSRLRISREAVDDYMRRHRATPTADERTA
jgi:excisionase family DNA binding protein